MGAILLERPILSQTKQKVFCKAGVLGVGCWGWGLGVGYWSWGLSVKEAVRNLQDRYLKQKQTILIQKQD